MPYLLYIIETIVLTILLGFVGIPLAKKYKARQSIRTEGPKSHRAKAGTPTMGGLFMILAAVLVTVCNHFMTETVIWLIILTLGHCLLGFLDDFIKAEKKRNLGLTAKQKFTGQILLALLFCYGVSHALNLPFAIAIPFTKVDISIGWLYYPFIVLVIVGASNAVNLTDGLDGLAACGWECLMLPLLRLSWQDAVPDSYFSIITPLRFSWGIQGHWLWVGLLPVLR